MFAYVVRARDVVGDFGYIVDTTLIEAMRCAFSTTGSSESILSVKPWGDSLESLQVVGYILLLLGAELLYWCYCISVMHW